MEKICKTNKIDLNMLNHIPLGKNLKRKYHDDITLLVIDLQKYRNI